MLTYLRYTVFSLTVTEIWPWPSLTELSDFGVLTFLFGVKQVLTLYYNDAWLLVI